MYRITKETTKTIPYNDLDEGKLSDSYLVIAVDKYEPNIIYTLKESDDGYYWNRIDKVIDNHNVKNYDLYINPKFAVRELLDDMPGMYIYMFNNRDEFYNWLKDKYSSDNF